MQKWGSRDTQHVLKKGQIFISLLQGPKNLLVCHTGPVAGPIRTYVMASMSSVKHHGQNHCLHAVRLLEERINIQFPVLLSPTLHQQD